jgi:hypothetical protein
MRGAPAAEGGTPSGLLNESQQIGNKKMVPLFLAAGLYRSVGNAQRFAPSDFPAEVDFLPVALANGGSDSHVDKSIPSISGFWPAESNKNDRWEYYFYGNKAPHQSWKHFQQELTWIQTPTPEQYRVFLWAETKLKTNTASVRYQVIDQAGGKRRGVLILNPLTNRFWVPAILTNSDTHAPTATTPSTAAAATTGTSATPSTNRAIARPGWEAAALS